MSHRLLFCFLLAVTVVATVRADTPSAEQLEFFESRIRPVLVAHCYACHNSVDTTEGGLALDHRAALLAGGDGGPIITPGKPADSHLLPILRHQVDGLEMPQDAPRLADAVLADFEKWIALGAPDPRDEPPTADQLADLTDWATTLEERKQWWSFQPITRPDVPPPATASTSDHPVDRFVDARLAAADLTPTPPADPAALLRRLSYALTGLPPAAHDLEGADYALALDRLLDSPRFAERWARHWMDWIRYAESHGSEGDPAIDGAYHYRDYLIRALDADVPLDQLVREHVAGDLLEDPRTNPDLGLNESLIATAHWRMVFHGFAPTDALDERVRFTDDAINTFSKAFLGLTVSCARCHNHKFDPISQTDYYALFGILGSTRPGRAVADLPDIENQNRDELAALKPRLRSALASAWSTAGADFADRLRRFDFDREAAKKPTSPFHLAALLLADVAAGDDVDKALDKQRAKHDIAEPPTTPEAAKKNQWNFAQPNDAATWFRYGAGLDDAPQSPATFVVATDGDRALARILPAGIYSHTLSSKHAARLTSPDVALDDDYDLWLRVLGAPTASARYVVEHYPRSGTVYPVKQLEPEWKWLRFDLEYWQGERVHVELTTARDAPLLVKNKPRSYFGITQAKLIRKGQPAPSDAPAAFHHLLDVALRKKHSAGTLTFDALADALGESLSRAVAAFRDNTATDAQAELLQSALAAGLLRNDLAQLPEVAPLVAEYRRLEADVPVPTRVPALDETTPRDQPLYTRGNHRNPAAHVPRRFLSALDPAPYDDSHSGRLHLAADLLADDNPLTRRVLVNRVWHHLLGAGIVATPDNFGRLGAEPSHPELLDYLATYLVDEGWSLKQLVRHVVTSDTFRRSAAPSSEAFARDPDNRLLSHAHLRRLDAEAIRDTLLHSSGRLDLTMYGPPVAAAAPRRAVYVRVIRNALDPFLRAFDFPEPFTAKGRRDATNIPAQSLALLNDPQVKKHAAAWATRVLDDLPSATDANRAAHMLRAAFSRPPTDDEVAAARAYLAETRNDLTELQLAATLTEKRIASAVQALESVLTPARLSLKLATASSNATANENAPAPIAAWDFTQSENPLHDTVGSAHLTLAGGAEITDSALRLDGRRAHAVSSPLPQDLAEKTLEVWLRLHNLDQTGGGAISVQSSNGVTFDAIVLGEKNPRHWLAGSNVFARTKPFAGPPESASPVDVIHFAIIYDDDGTITGYRDGQPYGNAYKSSGPVNFPVGDTVVGIGIRHLPATGNRLLAADVLRARLYDRALSADEVAASYAALPHPPTDDELLAALSETERARVLELRHEVAALNRELESLGPLPDTSAEHYAYSQLALAIFNMKEFIYLR